MSPPERAPTSVRAFAALESGVHSIPRADASATVQGLLAGTAADDSSGLVWIDVTNPQERESAYLRDELGLHPLAVEDCVRGRQRPKLDQYPDYFFLVLYGAAVNPRRDRMALKELHVFLGHRFIITVHDHRIEEIGEVLARWRSAPHGLSDVGTLAHLLLDAIIDDYFTIVEHFAQRTERFEGLVFGDLAPGDATQILLLRHELMLFRKVVAPQREVVSTMLRRNLPFVRPELAPYIQDVHDHIIRVMEEIDSLRELLSALLDAQMSFSTHQLNQTMRRLTAWSIILMSMALVAGIYGMNFVLMPELNWRWGYPFAILLMALIGASLVIFFRRRSWL